MGRDILVKACLNGNRRREEHPSVPIGPTELAREAMRAVAAGAGALHIHPRGPDGAETLDPDACAAAIAAVREACPGVPLGLSTGAWIAGGEERERLVAAWRVLPEFVSVNLVEEGAIELGRMVLDRGIGVEAGLTALADVEVLRHSGIAARMCRLLVEVEPEDADEAVALATAMDAALVEIAPAVRQLHHGSGRATWRVVEAAAARGRDVRIGLEDTLWLPDGAVARDNAELVAAAVALVGRAWPTLSRAPR
jgi:uncharacterized protein (DUF849 family)